MRAEKTPSALRLRVGGGWEARRSTAAAAAVVVPLLEPEEEEEEEVGEPESDDALDFGNWRVWRRMPLKLVWCSSACVASWAVFNGGLVARAQVVQGAELGYVPLISDALLVDWLENMLYCFLAFVLGINAFLYYWIVGLTIDHWNKNEPCFTCPPPWCWTFRVSRAAFTLRWVTWAVAALFGAFVLAVPQNGPPGLQGAMALHGF